jgi:hypothetical protein|tara:strand:+ start:1199 stop:1432 length:234 start_codon:yes stop_codon:yes gene_type:complete
MTSIAIITGYFARDRETREATGGTSVTGITVATDRLACGKDGVTHYGTEPFADKVDVLSHGNGSSDYEDNTDDPEID